MFNEICIRENIYVCMYENQCSEKKRELKTEKERKRQGNSALKKATLLGLEKRKERKRETRKR